MFSSIMFGFILLEKTDDDYMSNGVITGADFRECMCCGGWFIDIDTNRWRLFDIPENSGIKLDTEKFPLNVRLDWKKKDSACMSDEIIVLRIRKR
jgi:hypothetical protein